MTYAATDSVPVTLTYDYDGAVELSPPRRVELSITPDLAALFTRAAEVNRRDKTPLSFTSLLTGLVTGRDPVSVWSKEHLERYGATAVKITGRRSLEYDESLVDRVQAGSVPSIDLAMSYSARQAIEQGRKIAAELGGSDVLDVRHVAAAYPILPDWHLDDFKDLGIDRLGWCRAFGAYMARTHPDERWFWRKYADRAAPVPLTSFSADVYTEKDLLGIDRSVDALAWLIASTRTDTPLSIGVFGEWGSGKSFFMRHLRKRIWELAEREQQGVSAWIEKRESGTATDDDAPLYYGQVAQVEFNAWHYNEGNIVASLVDHLFRNLRVLPGAKDKELEERRAEVLVKISGAEVRLNEAATALEQARTNVSNAQTDLDRAKQEAESARRDVDTLSQRVADSRAEAEQARTNLDTAIASVTVQSDEVDAGALVAVALRPLTDSPLVDEVKRARDAFAASVTSWRTFGSQLLSVRGMAVVGLCLTAPLAAWLADWLTNKWAALAGVVTTGAASMAHVTGLIQERRKQFEATLAELEKAEADRMEQARRDLEQQRAALELRWKSKLEGLQQTLAQQRAALKQREETMTQAVGALADRIKHLDAKVQERTTAEINLLDLQARLKQLSSALLLDEFIKDRAGTDDYRKQLGFLALVRRDFERLSDLIASANDEWRSPKKTTPAPLLNRIVLYIDDLDRCKVETVMQVLEAVHLLLAFPLFVCVVAVDPRWIEECLRDRHKYLFSPGKEGTSVPVTVGDYLEKIFQIPIWMAPIEGRQRAEVVKSLLGNTAAPEGKNGRPARRTEAEHNLPRIGRAMVREDGFQAAVAIAEQAPDPLRITREEAQFVDRVAELLSEKPRALKRFVNTYRLLKASLSDIDRETFVSDGASSPYKMCISQLALFTGHPRLAPVLVKQLEHATDDDMPLSEWWNDLPADTRASLDKAVSLIPQNSEIRLKAFRAWLPETSRYLFHRETAVAAAAAKQETAATKSA